VVRSWRYLLLALACVLAAAAVMTGGWEVYRGATRSRARTEFSQAFSRTLRQLPDEQTQKERGIEVARLLSDPSRFSPATIENLKKIAEASRTYAQRVRESLSLLERQRELLAFRYGIADPDELVGVSQALRLAELRNLADSAEALADSIGFELPLVEERVRLLSQPPSVAQGPSPTESTAGSGAAPTGQPQGKAASNSKVPGVQQRPGGVSGEGMEEQPPATFAAPYYGWEAPVVVAEPWWGWGWWDWGPWWWDWGFWGWGFWWPAVFVEVIKEREEKQVTNVPPQSKVGSAQGMPSSGMPGRTIGAGHQLAKGTAGGRSVTSPGARGKNFAASRGAGAKRQFAAHGLRLGRQGAFSSSQMGTRLGHDPFGYGRWGASPGMAPYRWRGWPSSGFGAMRYPMGGYGGFRGAGPGRFGGFHGGFGGFHGGFGGHR
jgi:hypothetical protein